LTAPRSAPARPRFSRTTRGRGSQVLDDSAFSDEFCLFLQQWVPSVEAAELLLALAGEPVRPAVKPSDADAQRYLAQFQAAGLVAAGAHGAHHYRPVDEALAACVRMLAQAYKERPVTLFRVIYALRDHKIRSFAQVFKVKKR
jgi:hypothetical protein